MHYAFVSLCMPITNTLTPKPLTLTRTRLVTCRFSFIFHSNQSYLTSHGLSFNILLFCWVVVVVRCRCCRVVICVCVYFILIQFVRCAFVVISDDEKGEMNKKSNLWNLCMWTRMRLGACVVVSIVRIRWSIFHIEYVNKTLYKTTNCSHRGFLLSMFCFNWIYRNEKWKLFRVEI